MKYTHVRVDMGAAEKYYKAIWINSNENPFFQDNLIK